MSYRGWNEDEEKLLGAVAWLNAKALGLTLGIVLGLVIFIATNWLVIRGEYITEGGEHYAVGRHLQLLGQFFIGYRVSFAGSIIGFMYGFAAGTLAGALIGWIYNAIVFLRKQLKW